MPGSSRRAHDLHCQGAPAPTTAPSSGLMRSIHVQEVASRFGVDELHVTWDYVAVRIQ
jgi:hypothetical protein